MRTVSNNQRIEKQASAFSVLPQCRTIRPLYEQRDCRRVVLVLNSRPRNVLSFVERSLGIHYARQEELLQQLIGGINQQLLERIALQHLKSKSIEQTDPP